MTIHVCVGVELTRVVLFVPVQDQEGALCERVEYLCVGVPSDLVLWGRDS